MSMAKDGVGWVHRAASKKSAVNGRREAVQRIEEATHSQMRKRQLDGRFTSFLEFYVSVQFQTADLKRSVHYNFVAIQSPKLATRRNQLRMVAGSQFPKSRKNRQGADR